MAQKEHGKGVATFTSLLQFCDTGGYAFGHKKHKKGVAIIPIFTPVLRYLWLHF